MKRPAVLPPSDVPYYVVLLRDDILLDDQTYVSLDDCCHAAAPRPIATFTSRVAATRAARRIRGAAATPVLVE